MCKTAGLSMIIKDILILKKILIKILIKILNKFLKKNLKIVVTVGPVILS